MQRSEDIIRQAWMRVTSQRIAVLDSFDSHRSLNIGEIRDRLPKTSTMDVATLYRNISAFEVAGILHRIRADAEDRFFVCDHAEESHTEANNAIKNVRISYCRTCGDVREAHEESIPDNEVAYSQEERILKYCDACRNH